MRSLIVPVISTGNVAQLCVDVILHSFGDGFRFLKDIDSTMLHPFIGALDYVIDNEKKNNNNNGIYDSNEGKKKFSTPLELFCNGSGEIYVLQQRSPVIEGYEKEFFGNVIGSVIEEYDIDSLLVLDSAGVFDSSIPFCSSEIQSEFTFAECLFGPIDQLISQFRQGLNLNGEGIIDMNELFNFDSGSFQKSFSIYQSSYKLLYHLLQRPGICLKKIKYLSKLVQEGDNSWDAIQLCEHLGKIMPSLKVDMRNLKTPVSWEGVYGMRPLAIGYDEGIYS